MERPGLSSIYADAVYSGKRTLESVPELLRSDVEEWLVPRYAEAVINKDKTMMDVPEALREAVEAKIQSEQ